MHIALTNALKKKHNFINISILRIPDSRPSSMTLIQILYLTTSVQMYFVLT